MSDLQRWVLDASFEAPCFCPYDPVTGEVLIGMAVVSDRSPGPLAGVMHKDGQDAVGEWCAANPGWLVEYGPDPSR